MLLTTDQRTLQRLLISCCFFCILTVYCLLRSEVKGQLGHLQLMPMSSHRLYPSNWSLIDRKHFEFLLNSDVCGHNKVTFMNNYSYTIWKNIKECLFMKTNIWWSDPAIDNCDVPSGSRDYTACFSKSPSGPCACQGQHPACVSAGSNRPATGRIQSNEPISHRRGVSASQRYRPGRLHRIVPPPKLQTHNGTEIRRSLLSTSFLDP